MRFKFLLISLFCAMGILRAQDTIRTLIISEARIDNQHDAYAELTNVGNTDINLKDFEFGKVGPWTAPVTAGTTAQWFQVGTGDWFMLPDKVLHPGESFVMAKVNDWTPKMWLKAPDQYGRFSYQTEFDILADMKIHIGESPKAVSQSVDSISPMQSCFTVWNGSYCWYLRYHFMRADGDTTVQDSVVVDQVAGVFDDTDFSSRDVPHDVGGFPNATRDALLIRKNTVKKGNVNFIAGTDATDGEWISVPFLSGGFEPNRAVFWTVKNHGDFHLSSLTSSVMTINMTDSILTVPWGIKNNDSIMYSFNRIPGIAWHYDFAKNHEDSAFVSVRTGDKLTVWAAGNQPEKIVFKIVALPSTDDDNMVIPKYVPNNRGFYDGAGAYCEVSNKVPGMDTISYLPYAARVDSLMKYLEKPTTASWEIVWVDGMVRADLKMGDILKVTSKNGAVKNYYIKTNKFFPSHNGYLSFITWPDIPEFYKGVYGWNGDTIPSFIPSKLNYRVMVPWDVEGIPGLVGHKQDLNAKLNVKRALNLTGSTEDRSVTFTNTAQDDTTVKVYKVELMKEKDPSKIQSWPAGQPFISQFVWHQDFNNDFLEIVNPTPEPMDMSNYMFAFGYQGSAASAITSNSGTGDFATRYRKYIPGYKYVDATNWPSKPGILEPDDKVNAITVAGDVFVTAFRQTTSNASVIPQIDIDFRNNPWGEDLTDPYDACLRQWWGAKYFLFKILNDSIKEGLKAPIDPNDFELIDVFGDVGGDRLVIGGIPMDQVTQYVRKPEVFKGNPVLEGSFGTTEENSEWIMMNEGRYQAAGYGWPAFREMVSDGVGSHFMNDVTIYRSTVSSNTYKVSDGYSYSETIVGVGSGVNLTTFFSNIVKADTGQHLKVMATSDGSMLTDASIISMNDTLIVISADSANTSKYIIDVTPLSNDAVLVSTTYTINITGATGTISNFAYGTKLKDVFEGVTKPFGSLMNIIDNNGGYVAMKVLNFDTTYVDATVNDHTYFEVIAEDGITKIVYQLKPNVSNTDAFVTSDVYSVDQVTSTIGLVPNGTDVNTFLSNVIPVTGANLMLFDKLGLQRTFGAVTKDDKLVVTAADGVTTKTYYFTVLGVIQKYQAYVLSNVYAVGVDNTIKGGFTTSTSVATFVGNLIPAPSAEIKLYDISGIEKLGSTNLAEGDYIMVTSGDMSNSLVYNISFTTSAQLASQNTIRIYPNPTTEFVKVMGVETGSTIKVYNVIGSVILEKVVSNSTEQISFKNQPKGLYLIKVVTKTNKEFTAKIILNN